MNDPDRYGVIAGAGEAETKVKGSRFLGLAFPTSSVEAAEVRVEALRKEYHDATHVCFAWRVGHPDRERRRVADAGEPYGTAGTPIMQALERAEISDGLIAVVRWFGGTKLGTGGLIRAYGECARLALEDAPLGARTLRDPLTVTVDYARVSPLVRLAERYGARQGETDYGEEVCIRFAVPTSRLPAFRDAIVEATAGSARINETGDP